MTMPEASAGPGGRRPLLGRRNLFVLAGAIVVLTVGYGLLQAGYSSPAAVLLVLGYCVLFPLAIAL